MLRMLTAACALLALACAPAAYAEGASEEVSFTTTDGFLLEGTYYPGPPDAPAVLLMHQLGSDRSEFGTLAGLIQAKGISVLAHDARGHGKSTQRLGEEVHWEDFSDEDFLGLVKDIEAAILFLEEKKGFSGRGTGLVGASIQSSSSLLYASSHPGVNALVLLSPGLDYRGIKTAGPMAKYGERPVFIAAAKGDTRSHAAAVELGKTARGKVGMKIYEGAEHGAGMFRADPRLPEIIAGWLSDILAEGR